ncbi:class I SAM-dependent methyltransferase [Brevundimonas vesicularis]|uniref:class I SAM-dependent methyltransferase n=1 Tax=Brevundimonas vesicularis TaxID=41276 RepID=UPI0038D3629D
MSTPRPLPHAMSPMPDFEEQARLDFAMALKGAVRGPLREALPKIYEQEAAPAWQAEHGRPPQAWREVSEAMSGNDSYRWWSALSRAQQEYYVDVTSTVCERQHEELIERYRKITGGTTLGTLSLDDRVALPAYQGEVDIHCVPGSYFIERTQDDLWSGARSDLGSFVFSMGKHGALNDGKGQVGAAFIKERFPDLKVKRVLDLGCTVGLSTLPYCDAFPEAQIHALDLSAPSLRYGHARAEALGKAVHFQQGNAERTSYEAGSFDLVVSHILLHETSRIGLEAILAECHRLLRPGGVMLHIEVPVRRTDAFDQFLTNWDATHNNEPFWSTLAEMDLIAPAVRAGFEASEVFEVMTSTQSGALLGGWLAYGARKAGVAQ